MIFPSMSIMESLAAMQKNSPPMQRCIPMQQSIQRDLVVALIVALGMIVFVDFLAHSAFAQENAQTAPSFNEQAPSIPIDDGATVESDQSTSASQYKAKGLNLLTLLTRGGWFMLPLALLSILVVGVAIERMLALREDKILPKPLVRDLGQLSRNPEGFDPRMAFQTCQAHPSAASRVLRVMLLKAGRPQSEVEHAVGEAAEREATRLQAIVSWLVLAAAVAPLIGLLGTVWGMIQAFYDTTQLVAGQNKAEVLAQGIYIALVTTLSGLIIAIPAAILAHFYDNRIVAWFHKIEELAASLTPMLEPYEGRMRASDNSAAFADDEPTRRASQQQVVSEPVAAAVAMHNGDPRRTPPSIVSYAYVMSTHLLT